MPFDLSPLHAASRQNREALTRQFADRVELSSAGYLEVRDWESVGSHVGEYGCRVVISPRLDQRVPELRAALERAAVPVVVPGGDDPVAQAVDAEIGVVAGELGVAETGSVLVVEHAIEDRVVSMLCRRLVVVVERSAIVGRLEDAAEWLSVTQRGGGFASLITGPSRTADIERSLTIGVQGPQDVDVVVLA